MSWLLFSKSSANVSRPLGPSKTYCLSTFSHGSARRCRLSSSRSRVNSFSLASNAVRSESNSAYETTGWSLILLLPSFVIVLVLSVRQKTLLALAVMFIPVPPDSLLEKGCQVSCQCRPASNVPLCGFLIGQLHLV